MKKSLTFTIAIIFISGLLSTSCNKSGGVPPVVDTLMAQMVTVEGGSFTMGATSEQKTDVKNDEKPLREVTLTTYKIGRYEVTQAQWKAVMGDNPSQYKGDEMPVTNVSWDDVQLFIKKLNEITGRKFRLPTEAEWEYAARGGNKSLHTEYAGEAVNYKRVAWCFDNMSKQQAHDVGGKEANELGLYDMSGNVWEWCQDWYGDYPSKAETNPKGPSAGENRCDRGGAWDSNAPSLRVAYRDSGAPQTRAANVGFRLAE